MNIRKFETTSPKIHPSAFIDKTALVIGKVEIGEESSVWPMTVIRGDVNYIVIGKRSNIQDASVLHVTHASKDYTTENGYPLIIENDVTVGHKALLHACKIGNRVLVGMGSIIMDGVIIEDETIIGAGSLVPPNKTLQSGYLWMGSPAKKVRPLTDKEKQYLKYSAEHYVRLKEKHQK
ncbi:MAG TPA: gamma carbonic anhydrase family protein [Leucothrix sp.]|nr:gamma carbonic anhydrase family protein [Leucothrix sp.]